MYKKVTTLAISILMASALSACTPNQVVVDPTQSATPSPTVQALTAEDVWNSFVQLADQSCKAAYDGLVEEDVAGPEVGKLKIRLTFDQAGENTMAFSMPNGDVGMLQFQDFYACEAQFLFITLDEDGSSSTPIQLSPDWPFEVTYNPQNSTYSTLQTREDGTLRNLVYSVSNSKFSRVEDLDSGSVTTLVYGQPNAALTQVVNDFYAAYFAG